LAAFWAVFSSLTLKDDQWTADTTATITPPKAAGLSANQSVMLTEIEQLIAGPNSQLVRPATISVLVVSCSRASAGAASWPWSFIPPANQDW
jgi:hypothetical protein